MLASNRICKVPERMPCHSSISTKGRPSVFSAQRPRQLPLKPQAARTWQKGNDKRWLQIYADAPTAHRCHFRRKRTTAIVLLARGLTWYLVQLRMIHLTSCCVVAVEPFGIMWWMRVAHISCLPSGNQPFLAVQYEKSPRQ